MKIERTTAFKRDFKRERKGPFRTTLEELLNDVVTLLAKNAQLPMANKDHPMSGPWKDHRDCHLAPDLVLIYRKPAPHTLQLVRLGSHAELFG